MTDATRDLRITDLIGYALDGKPVEFQNTFNDIVSDRLTVAVDARKLEVAKNIFNEPEQEEELTDGEVPTGDTGDS